MLPLGLSGSEKENIKEEETNEKGQNASQSSRCWADRKPKLTTLGQPKDVEVLQTGGGGHPRAKLLLEEDIFIPGLRESHE